MKNIGSHRGFQIYWSDPVYDGGSGTGEVMVGSDSVGKATSKSQAMEIAKNWIERYKGK